MPRTERMHTRVEWSVAARAAALLSLVAGSAVSSAQVGLNDLLDAAEEAVDAAPDMSGASADDATLDDLADRVSVDEHFLVDLHVNDEDLANVLQMLSIQSQRNIVASKDVSASVTANLYGVTFYEALDAILNVNGYGYIERGNFIYVYTLEELGAIEQANRQREARVIKLNHLNATDAAAFVAPMLSEGGSITTNGRTGAFSIPQDAPVGADEFAHESTLVIFDYADRIDEIERLVAQLDTRPQQVLVESTILQSSLSEANAFGVDFSLIGDLNFGDFLGPLDATNALLSGRGDRVGTGEVQVPSDNIGFAGTSSAGNVAGGAATFRAGFVMEDLAIFMRLLDEVSDTTILSNPKLLTLNRQPARVLVGRKVGYLSTTNTETASTQTVEFLDTGTQLYVRPFVTNDGFIRMELKPQVSEAVIRDVTDATGATVTIPDEITNELTANVMVRDGQTVVLGGLFRESTVATRRQVPIMGDIPIIGAAFRGYDDETARSEIIFLITPSIVNDDRLLADGAKASDYIEDVRTGARLGTLPFSRERQSQQLLVEAERLAATGNNDKALHKVRRSLELNPMQPNAIRLQERLLSREAIWPSRSLLESIYHNDVQRREERLRRAEPAMPRSPLSGGAMSSADHSRRGATPRTQPANNADIFAGNANAQTPGNAFVAQADHGAHDPADSFAFSASVANGDPLFANNAGPVESWPAPAPEGVQTSQASNIPAPIFDDYTFSRHIENTHPYRDTQNPYIEYLTPQAPAFPSDLISRMENESISQVDPFAQPNAAWQTDGLTPPANGAQNTDAQTANAQFGDQFGQQSFDFGESVRPLMSPDAESQARTRALMRFFDGFDDFSAQLTPGETTQTPAITNAPTESAQPDGK